MGYVKSPRRSTKAKHKIPRKITSDQTITDKMGISPSKAQKSKKPRGFPEDKRTKIHDYLQRGYCGVIIEYTIDGKKQQDHSPMICNTFEIAEIVEKCKGRKVNVKNIEYHFIGNTCDMGGWYKEFKTP
jgi:hypothetical protein